MMLGLILSLLGVGGSAAALLYFVGPTALLGIGRQIFAVLARIPWQLYAVAALAGLLAFLIISRGHALDRARKDEANLAQICAAVRDAAGRPHQDCGLNVLQIRALGASVKTLEAALDDQNRRIRALGEQTKAQQAAAAAAERLAAHRAAQADDVATRLEQSSRRAPAKPCAVSKELESQWQ